MKDNRENDNNSHQNFNVENESTNITPTIKTTTPVIFGYHVPPKDLNENKISFINSLTNNCAQRLQLVVEPIHSREKNFPCSYFIGLLLMRNKGNNSIDAFDPIKHSTEELTTILKNELDNFDLSFNEPPKILITSYNY